MNTNKTRKKSPFRSRIVVRLWLLMMLLVALGIAFMWVAQIFLFEQNYLDATVSEVQSRLQPIMEELNGKDLSDDEPLILSLSKSTNGKTVLIYEDGTVIALYSAGHRLMDDESLGTVSETMQFIMQSEEYQQILLGKPYDKIIRSNSEPIMLEIGIPVLYNNRQASAVLFHSLDQLQTVLGINRRQLMMVSILLTLSAALLAALLSRRFVKPIRIIKDTVDSLAKGELTATPGLSLNDELGQLSDSVEELGQALQRVDVLRKEVIANVSHELRAPLALIKGYSEMVRDINWKDNEKRNEDLNLIISEAGRMSEMVSDIMDYSQLQAGYIQLKKGCYNLYEIAESEVAHCEQNAHECNIFVRLVSKAGHSDPPNGLPCSQAYDISVHVDALKISQVMRNLLNNAVNHTADGEIISVTIEEANRKIRVSVINPGAPIPEEDREMIWERYQRSQHHGGRKKGTGIGLSIVSTFLKAHNMPYGVDCADGFTTFWFECSVTSFYNVQHKIKPKTESQPTQRAALVRLKAAQAQEAQPPEDKTPEKKAGRGGRPPKADKADKTDKQPKPEKAPKAEKSAKAPKTAKAKQAAGIGGAGGSAKATPQEEETPPPAPEKPPEPREAPRSGEKETLFCYPMPTAGLRNWTQKGNRWRKRLPI